MDDAEERYRQRAAEHDKASISAPHEEFQGRTGSEALLPRHDACSPTDHMCSASLRSNSLPTAKQELRASSKREF